jgi:hypothetical protein
VIVPETDRAIAEQLDGLPDDVRRALHAATLADDDLFGFPGRHVDVKAPTRALEEVLSHHPKFGQGRIFRFAAKQLHLHPAGLAPRLILIAAKYGTQYAIDWLNFVFEVERTDLRYVVEVYGVKLSSKIVLPNGVEILAFGDLADSPMSRWLVTYPNIHLPFGSAPTSWEAPVAAILTTTGVRASDGWLGQSDPSGPMLDQIVSSVMALTIAEENAPYVGRSWVEFTDLRLRLAEPGRSHYGSRSEGALISVIPAQIDQTSLDWVNRYLELDDPFRRTLDVAIQRLNTAKRRSELSDKAIEGAICLEALLLGDGIQQELRYRLALRGAKLLGSNLDERLKLRTMLNKFYDLRSTAVHGGRIDAKSATDVKSGLAICVRLLQKLVELRKPPDWSVVELT